MEINSFTTANVADQRGYFPRSYAASRSIFVLQQLGRNSPFPSLMTPISVGKRGLATATDG
jgi:hypothetical protein